ncbi:hypothetical protein ACFL39_00695 [Gemmatimonadota bacterium]
MRNISRFQPARFLLRGVLVALTVIPLWNATAQEPVFNTLILSPEPGETVPQTTSMISVSFIDSDRLLDINSIRLHVDGNDLTSDANINGDLLVWLAAAPLNQGPHRIVIQMKARDGSDLPSLNWSFLVGPPPEGVTLTASQASEERKGLPIWALASGNVTVEGARNSVGGEGAAYRREPAGTAKAAVTLRGRLGGSWRYNALARFSSYESHTMQPINRLGFTLRSNWLTLSLGDVNPRIQELILWGRRVRGWSLDMRGGIVNVSVVSGQSRRTVTPELYDNDPTKIWRLGTWQQDLLAIRPYFGSGRGFQFGLTFMKVRDDTTSISPLMTAADVNGLTRSARPDPKDNLVIGMDLSIKAFRGKFSVSYNNAVSLYNNDILGGPITQADLDTLMIDQGYDPIELPIDPKDLADLFILNASMIPLDPTGLTSLAHQVRGSLQVGTHTLGARWRSIGGSYHTLGYASLPRDRAGLRIQDSFRMFNNNLGVTVGWESFDDNLDDTKAVTTGTSALTLDLFWQSDATAPGFSVGYRDYARQNDATDLSSGGVDETTGTVSAGAYFPMQLIPGLQSRLNINYTTIGREDVRNTLTGSQNDYYMVGFTNRFTNRPTEFSVTYGINTSELTGYEDALTTFNRLLLKGRHAINQKLSALADIVMTTASSPEAAGSLGLDYNRTEMTGGAEYYWSTTSFASLRAGYISYTDNRQTGFDTTQFVVRLRLTQAF